MYHPLSLKNPTGFLRKMLLYYISVTLMVVFNFSFTVNGMLNLCVRWGMDVKTRGRKWVVVVMVGRVPRSWQPATTAAPTTPARRCRRRCWTECP